MARWLELIPLDDLLRRPAPRNPKVHDEPGIRASITKHGLVENPAIDERTGRLVAGHGRLDDLADRRARGEEPPDGIEVGEEGTWLVPTQRGWHSKSDADAESYVVGSNYLVISGGMDEKLLAEMYADHREEPDWLLGTGIDEKEVVTFLASAGGGDPQAPEDFPSYDEGIETTHQCPKCGYAWSGASGG